MSGPGVGFEYPPIEVAWLKRDLLLFANSIGVNVDELHFLYVRRSFLVIFPTVMSVHLTPSAGNCPSSSRANLAIATAF